MIPKIIEYSIRNRFVVIVTVLAIAAIGLYSLARTPIDAIPDLSENQVIVFADWMGRSPQEIEDQVTYPLSVNLQGLAGVKAVRSTSEFNFSMINIIFEDDIEFYFARERVLERLSTAATFLPKGVVPYLAPDATALGQIFWYTVEGEGRDLGELRSIQDWFVRYQLNSIPGVAQVSSVGGFVKTYEVSLDPERLRAYGVALGNVVSAVQRGNSAVGGNVYIKNNAEYLIRGVGWIEDLDGIRQIVVAQRGGVPVTVGDLGTVQISPEPRRSVLEKDGKEAVGGVVLMRYGENPLEITKRIKQKIADLQAGLPDGVRIVPFYDRTRLIESAIGTVTRTLTEEIIIASIAVLLILTHIGSAFVVVVTLPLAVLISFTLMRLFGISSNIMSLSGIAISIGVLVDASIVMVENATHELTAKFGTRRVTGDTQPIIEQACRLVGRPIFFSVLIMLVSFLPVFALSGMEGKMFHPLAFTKTFAMIGVAVLAITLVPAMLGIFLRGRLRSEMENPIVRSFIEIYRPVLRFLLRHPKPFIWSFVVLLGIGLHLARDLGREFMPPLDEGSILEMPVTIPSASAVQVAQDLRVRDGVLRSFPEVERVVGKAGRADTPTDPAPLDMIETVVGLHPRDWWPKRKVRFEDVGGEASKQLQAYQKLGIIRSGLDEMERSALLNDAAMQASQRTDRRLRTEALALQARATPEIRSAVVGRGVDELVEQARAVGAMDRRPSGEELREWTDWLLPEHGSLLAGDPDLVSTRRLLADARDTLAARGQLVIQQDLFADRPSLLARTAEPLLAVAGRERPGFEERVLRAIEEERDRAWRRASKRTGWALADQAPAVLAAEVSDALLGLAGAGEMIEHEASSEERQEILAERTKALERDLFLWRVKKEDLVQEMDSELQMPGWGNIWTQPIINRVDMLATGVRTMVGVKVFGDDLHGIQAVSEEVADVLRAVPGAVDVFPDQIVGENYLEIEVDRARAARYGISVGDVQDLIEVALGGMTVTTTVEGRERYPVRVRFGRDFRLDEEAIGRIPVGIPGGMASATAIATGMAMSGAPGAAMESPVVSATGIAAQVPLSEIASIRVVQGPSMIKSENGLLRSYVQLNVRGRDVVGFVEDAQRLVQEKVSLPPGYYLEWSGQFEHQVRARRTLQVVFPAVILLIFMILYLTFHDFAQALLMMLAIPGALVGGVIFQTIFGFDFSVAVWIGYIAAFGMATETGVVMMVYLREALRRRGGLEAIREESEIADVVIEGAVHRLRPKLLTEAVAIVGLMPMLWAHGTGAEVMRPMAAPVLGGLLVADEVIDLLLPVLFHWLQTSRWRRMLRSRAA